MRAKQNRISSALLIVVLLVLATDGFAITIRHDREPWQYTNLAAEHPYGGMVSGAWLGSGTLISPNWVLTAAHVLQGASLFTYSGGSVAIDYTIDREDLEGYDIGLAHLASPVTSIEPIKLYDLAFGVEDYQESIIMGVGATGTGYTGQGGGAGTRRAAETWVYTNASSWGWPSIQVLTKFRSPGDPNQAYLEGAAAQGDSGGGLLLNVDGQYAIAGVASYAWGEPIGSYGNGSAYVRSAPLNDWILQYATDAEVLTLNDPPTVHYTFKEASPGTWEVYVDVTGEDTAGLSAYELWVDNVDPSLVSFEENILWTAHLINYAQSPIGFSPSTLVQGDVGGHFNAGNFQGSGDVAIEGIGMVEVFEETSLPGIIPSVELDVPALLGVFSTPTGLGEDDFRAITVGLLNKLGDNFFDTNDIIPTLEVIPLAWLVGDANLDGKVSAGDYASVQANFGNTGPAGGWLAGDANGDGVVSAGDYASVQANFGNTAAGDPIPEPGTMCIVAMGLVIMARRKRN